MKIIVVDDNMNIGDLLAEILIEKGHDARYFSKPSEALRSMQGETYDVALLDVRMPEMDGFALCKLIKADDAIKNVRVLFASSYTSEEYISKASTCGAEGYIDKNLPPDQVVAEIEKVIK